MFSIHWMQQNIDPQQARLDGGKKDIQRAANYREIAKRVLQEKIQNTTISKEGIKHVSKKL